MHLSSLGNYKLFLLSNSILSFALGLFTPFYIIFLQDFGGGIQQFGFAIGLMVLAGSIASYFGGKYSDRLGRKPFLIIGGFLLVLITLSYTLISNLPQLYVLQVLNGAVNSLQTTLEMAFLADITGKVSRGLDIGKYHAIVGVMGAFAMMAGGYVVGDLGFRFLFYITAGFMLVSTLFLFSVKEQAKL